MTIETYTRQQILPTDVKVNSYVTRVKWSQTMIKAVQQGLIARNGKGIKDKFISAEEVKQTARVMVLRQIPHDISARVVGNSSVNGGYGDERDAYIASTETVYIDCLNYYDRHFEVPEIQENLIDRDVLAGELANYEISLVLDLNGGTLAKRFEKSLFGEKNLVEWDTSTNITTALGKAISRLQKGDKEHGFGLFPLSSMLAGVSFDAYDTLLGASVLVGGNLGTYNTASQEMIAKGVISPNAENHFEDDGYVGKYRNIDFHVLSDSIVDKAEKYLGLGEGDILDNGFIGFVGTSYANARGITSLKDIKVVDSIKIRGKRLQPLISFGVECFYPKGNVFVYKQNSVDVKAKLANYWSGALEIKAIPFGSRALALAEVSAIATTGFTATIKLAEGVKTNPGVASSSLINSTGYFVQSDAPIKNFKDFDTAYNATSAVAGTFTSGTAVSETLTSGKYLNLLVSGKDGTLAVYSALVA